MEGRAPSRPFAIGFRPRRSVALQYRIRQTEFPDTLLRLTRCLAPLVWATVISLIIENCFAVTVNYPIVGTGQAKCYDNRNEIDPPKPGQAFYGQDAQHTGNQPSYTLSADGLTVQDNNTGLTWQRSPHVGQASSLLSANAAGGKLEAYPTYHDKLTFTQAKELPLKLNAMKFGGFTDWRLPTIKELYSLILFSGVDSGPNASPTGMKPFLDTKFFKFAYGDEVFGERTIDSQWATSTTYVANPNQMFGVNFADGRIKGYGASMPGRGEKKFYVICCRGNPQYGKNEFHDNGDGTITDRATGLVWQKNDSGKGMNWEQALAYAAKAGNGWRLPNAKELQSILNYSRSPDMTGSAAINPVFRCTAIINEAGRTDYPFYWSSTTHVSTMGGSAGVYIAFGRAAGWPSGMGLGGPGPGVPPPGGRGYGGPPSGPGGSAPRYADVHGAGAQRSDPKTGNPSDFPRGRGPQGDVVRINNYVRLVRDDMK